MDMKLHSDLVHRDKDKYFGYITKVFQAFEQAEWDLVQQFRMSREIEEEREALRYVLSMGI